MNKFFSCQAEPLNSVDQASTAVTEASRLASTGDAIGAIEALYTSGFIDGLVRRLESSWGQLDRAAAEDCIADAVGALYATVAAGQRIRSAEGYVFKAAQYLAGDEHDRRIAESELDERLVAQAPDEAFGPSRSRLRHEALRAARSLVPRLGQENIRRVMTMYLDAISDGLQDLPARDVAEALHLDAATVRKLKQRGFDRLARLADETGLTRGLADLLDNDDFEEEDDDR